MLNSIFHCAFAPFAAGCKPSRNRNRTINFGQRHFGNWSTSRQPWWWSRWRWRWGWRWRCWWWWRRLKLKARTLEDISAYREWRLRLAGELAHTWLPRSSLYLLQIKLKTIVAVTSPTQLSWPVVTISSYAAGWTGAGGEVKSTPLNSIFIFILEFWGECVSIARLTAPFRSLSMFSVCLTLCVRWYSFFLSIFNKNK